MRKKLIFILALSILISLQLSLITFARAGGGGGGVNGGGSSSGSSNREILITMAIQLKIS